MRDTFHMVRFATRLLFNFGTPRWGEDSHLPGAAGKLLGKVKEMAGKWILGGVPGGPKKSGWVGRLDPPPPGGLKKKPVCYVIHTYELCSFR